MTRLICALAWVLALSAGEVQGVEPPDTCRRALRSVETLTGDRGATAAVESAIAFQLGKLAEPKWAPGYCRAIVENFASKIETRNEGVAFTTRALIDTGVAFEAFRVTAFRNSGVAPKRYFGFLDERGKAAVFEKRLKTTAARVAPMLNAYASRKGLKVTVSPKEVVVTHIAEGGALLLSTEFDSVDRVHPVAGVGLDDFRRGFRDYADLVREIDGEFKTKLAALADMPRGPVSMTFEESVLGTAVMYLWEKAIAEEKRRAEGRPSLSALSLDEQFVQASLVYNSGILFTDQRVKQIMAFDTAAYLVETSEKFAYKRPRLPVLSNEAADALLERGEALPRQPTSWNAVYHILQRYGAWVALARFSNDFTADGSVVAAH